MTPLPQPGDHGREWRFDLLGGREVDAKLATGGWRWPESDEVVVVSSVDPDVAGLAAEHGAARVRCRWTESNSLGTAPRLRDIEVQTQPLEKHGRANRESGVPRWPRRLSVDGSRIIGFEPAAGRWGGARGQ